MRLAETANSDDTIRALRDISEANRRTFALRELTPFHVTDEEVERSQAALHYPIRSDEMRLGQITPSTDLLDDAISIAPRNGQDEAEAPVSKPSDPPEQRERRKRWRFDDED